MRVPMRGFVRSAAPLLNTSVRSSPDQVASNLRRATRASWRDTHWPSADGARGVALSLMRWATMRSRATNATAVSAALAAPTRGARNG